MQFTTSLAAIVAAVADRGPRGTAIPAPRTIPVVYWKPEAR